MVHSRRLWKCKQPIFCNTCGRIVSNKQNYIRHITTKVHRLHVGIIYTDIIDNDLIMDIILTKIVKYTIEHS